MPRLLFFLACERAVVGQEDNALSIISVMNEVLAYLPFPAGEPIPQNTSIPLRWYLVSGWKRDPDGGPFEQRVIFRSPDGEELLCADLFFERGKEIVRGIVGFTGFPVGHHGECTAILYIRSDEKWNEAAQFPITVKTGPIQDSKTQTQPEQ